MGMADDDAALSLPRSAYVQSVARAMDLLKAVADARGEDATAASLAQRCGLNRATGWRLLMTLEAQGMVVRSPGSGTFVLGPAVAELHANQRQRKGLAEQAQPMLERLSLETGEIACLGVVEGERVEYAAEAIPAIVDDCSWLGEPVALHASSIGKAFLASLEPHRVRELLVDGLRRYTETTITDVSALEAELTQVRSRGYAVCRGELEIDSWGVAAPVHRRGRLVAAVCLWGPVRRGDDTRLAALGQLARRAAQELARI
jgi:IclR family acetate operon transcriptional repressor